MRTWNRGLEAEYIRKKARIYHGGTETTEKILEIRGILGKLGRFSLRLYVSVVMYFACQSEV